VTLVQKPGLGH